jgi:hypothetical protein
MATATTTKRMTKDDMIADPMADPHVVAAAADVERTRAELDRANQQLAQVRKVLGEPDVVARMEARLGLTDAEARQLRAALAHEKALDKRRLAIHDARKPLHDRLAGQYRAAIGRLSEALRPCEVAAAELEAVREEAGRYGVNFPGLVPLGVAGAEPWRDRLRAEGWLNGDA